MVVVRNFDYFTSCLPAPQKGPDVGIGISGIASVYGNGKALGLTNGTAKYGLEGSSSLSVASGQFGKPLGTPNITSETPGGTVGVVTKTQLGSDLTNSGLIADMSTASAVTVNALRIAFATQKAYEKDARGGTRYVEMIKSHFGVTSPDARQQRPEYLGGNRVPIQVNQVVQSSGEIGSTPLGNTGAYRDWETDRKSTRLNSSHSAKSRMPSSA